jgi:hypothetical protein
MLEAVAIIALVLSAIAIGLSLGNSSRIESHDEWHNSYQLIRTSVDRCTQSQIGHITYWLKDVERMLKAQEEEE